MGKGYLLGVDIGTYSSKGVLVDEVGHIVASAVTSHEVDMPRPGHFEHDAEGVWWHDFVVIVRSLLAQTGIDPRSILSIGTSGIGPCVLPVDEEGKPLRRAILYGIDTRATQEIAYLEGLLGRENIFKRCGVYLDSQTAGPKILWIRNNEPEVYRRARWFLTSQGYLVYKLTGIPSIDIYTAASFAPLFDLERFLWREDLAEYITPSNRLPQVYWSVEVVGKVKREAAQETGLAEGTPVVAGTADAAAESVSVGVRDFGDMMLMLGSSVFFIVKVQELVKTRRFWSAPFLENDTFAFLGGMSTGGSLTKWFRDHFAPLEVEGGKEGRETAYEALARLASQSTIGARGLIALPYFAGERTPLRDPQAVGMLFGLRLEHARGDVYRAILESVGFGIRHNLEAMREEGVCPKRVFAVGGGTKNTIWMRIIADIANMPLVVSEPQIGASYGDAFMAGVGIGFFSGLQEITRWVRVREIVEPSLENHKEYALYYELFRRLYEVNRPLMEKLSELVRKEEE